MEVFLSTFFKGFYFNFFLKKWLSSSEFFDHSSFFFTFKFWDIFNMFLIEFWLYPGDMSLIDNQEFAIDDRGLTRFSEKFHNNITFLFLVI